MGDEKIKECNDSLKILKEIKDVADSGFENKIMYISAGAIAVAISALDRIECTSSIWLIIGICFLVLTLIINTGYDLFQSIYTYRKGEQIQETRDPHNNDIYDFDNWTKIVNIIVLISFIIGTLCLTIGAIKVINNNEYGKERQKTTVEYSAIEDK